MKLTDKVALVMGAGSIGPGIGNGKAAAIAFAREGAAVLAADIDAAAAAETCALVAAEGGTALAVRADVTDPADVAAAVALCMERFGRIDVLHNNVGIFRPGGAIAQTEADWDAVIATNLRGLFLACRAALPHMVAQGAGSIINVGSISGTRFLGLPVIAYATSKGGVSAFTRSIAAEFGPRGVRANAIVPGIIDTPTFTASGAAYAERFGAAELETLQRARAATIPLRRFGSAWDVAKASVFLASDDAAYVTGSEILVDGGLSCVAPQPQPA